MGVYRSIPTSLVIERAEEIQPTKPARTRVRDQQQHPGEGRGPRDELQGRVMAIMSMQPDAMFGALQRLLLDVLRTSDSGSSIKEPVMTAAERQECVDEAMRIAEAIRKGENPYA